MSFAKVTAMDILAKQCFAKYYTTYILDEGALWQGEKAAQTLTGPPVLTQINDDGPLHRYGVRMEFTVQGDFAMDCVNTMFD